MDSKGLQWITMHKIMAPKSISKHTNSNGLHSNGLHSNGLHSNGLHWYQLQQLQQLQGFADSNGVKQILNYYEVFRNMAPPKLTHSNGLQWQILLANVTTSLSSLAS